MQKELQYRDQELKKFQKNEPILVFLRKLKIDNLYAFEKILFYFGEIDHIDRSFKHTVWWCTDSEELNIIEQAFHIVCPNGYFELKDYGNNFISFRYCWNHDNDMHPIIFNKHIFPDFSEIDKKYLHF